MAAKAEMRGRPHATLLAGRMKHKILITPEKATPSAAVIQGPAMTQVFSLLVSGESFKQGR
jgi:hypothetical protein